MFTCLSAWAQWHLIAQAGLKKRAKKKKAFMKRDKLIHTLLHGHSWMMLCRSRGLMHVQSKQRAQSVCGGAEPLQYECPSASLVALACPPQAQAPCAMFAWCFIEEGAKQRHREKPRVYTVLRAFSLCSWVTAPTCTTTQHSPRRGWVYTDDGAANTRAS